MPYQRIDDGHPTLISLAGGEFLWEKTVTPPGMDGGGANDTTTMHNTEWRTNAPKHLRTLTDTSFNSAYSTFGLYGATGLKTIINLNQQINITFADGTGVNFWGWLNAFTPGESSEGSQPTASCTIIGSNQDETGIEVAPEYVEAAGGYNPQMHTYKYIIAKQLELMQRIREGKENPELFSLSNLNSGVKSKTLFDSFPISDVRQKIRDRMEV